jgi:hypothetical protein
MLQNKKYMFYERILNKYSSLIWHWMKIGTLLLVQQLTSSRVTPTRDNTILGKIDIISVNNVNHLVSIMETQSISCEVGTESLNIIHKRPCLQMIWFSSVFMQILDDCQDPRCYCPLVMQTSPLKFIRIKHYSSGSRQNYISKLHNFTLIKKILISLSLSQATPCNNPKVFIFTRLLSQKREGEASERSSKQRAFMLQRIKRTDPVDFT